MASTECVAHFLYRKEAGDTWQLQCARFKDGNDATEYLEAGIQRGQIDPLMIIGLARKIIVTTEQVEAVLGMPPRGKDAGAPYAL